MRHIIVCEALVGADIGGSQFDEYKAIKIQYDPADSVGGARVFAIDSWAGHVPSD
jgi:hypothetical protein